MIRSMTAFGERSFNSRSLRLKISVKSLNHRYFDWIYKGTPVGEVENRLRALCQKKIHRGRVEVSLEWSCLDPSGWELSVNEGLLDKVLSVLERASARSGKTVQFSVENIFRIPQMIELKRKDFTPEETAFIESCFEKTLDEVIKGRLREGKAMEKQIRRHARNIRLLVNRIEKLFRKQPHLIRGKLRQRAKELDSQGILSEERFEEEVAYLIQRYDLAEEITRLKSHLESLRNIFSPENKQPAGRMLDFIAQELYREANTINSKSQDLAIIKDSLAVKGEVESIRQLVQNIE